jgi:hypothetical protein
MPGPQAAAATPAGRKVTPRMLAVGAVVLAVVIGIVAYMSMSAKSGSITVTPSSFSCSSSTQVMAVMRLSASMQATDMLTFQTDGVTKSSDTVDSTFARQTDGSWLFSEPSTASSVCQGSGGPLTIGNHTLRILDAGGKVLAEGSYTLTP